ncbi:MAG TPA: UbiA family prenyltransferase [Candidatus Dormibacteraeota bacterium]|nr:UbiA family prenyltransferase [Candidatus Dormibacteraeota bacterium]
MATPQAPQSTSHPLAGPPGASRRPALLRLLDERDPAGGRAKAALFLFHPGPSLLVTAVTLGAAAIALRGAPGWSLALRLVLLMLPAQLAIGAVNDLADARADREGKPHKPLVRGAVSRNAATIAAVLLIATSLASAAALGGAVLLATICGLGAGLAYDVGLKRSRLSLLPWWLGFTALPFCAFAAAGHVPRALWWCLPLAAVLALGLHCANVLPDVDADRRDGIRNLPVLLGVRRSRVVALGALLGCAALTAVLATPLHQTVAVLGIAWAAVVLCVAVAATQRFARAPFPVLAPAAAALAVCWLASLPR